MGAGRGLLSFKSGSIQHREYAKGVLVYSLIITEAGEVWSWGQPGISLLQH